MRKTDILNILLTPMILLYSFGLLNAQSPGDKTKARTIGIEEFVKRSIENDDAFEEILIDELALKYDRTLALPAGDMILSVKSQFEFDPHSSDSENSSAVSLDKLFPYTGTDISIDYDISPSVSSSGNSSELDILLSQQIAKNAFGRSTKLLDNITELGTQISRHQIIEAYEDYLSAVIVLYYEWYSSYENLKIAESSNRQSIKLLKNIQSRKQNRIALDIDVNKMRIQVLEKKGSLISQQNNYTSILNSIKRTLRYSSDDLIEPADPLNYRSVNISFEKDYRDFKKKSRTSRILELIEETASLEIKKDTDDILPSANIYIGYKREGSGASLENPDNLLYTGISFQWPLPDSVSRARLEISKLNEKRTSLSVENKHIQLYTDLQNLALKIKREQDLISIASDKIKLSQSILDDETENYSYGKVTLNDYIAAVNRLDTSKFELIQHSVLLKILTTEWLRITDRLVSQKEILKNSE